MDIITRIKTVATAVVFWLGIAGAAIAIILDELADYIDQPVIAGIVGILGPIAAIITVLSVIISRVTEVIPADRGLLPVAYPNPIKSRITDRDSGFVESNVIWTIVGILAIVALVLYIVGR